MKQKTAFITGITGQDGAYLAAFLLEKGYVVHGLLRRASVCTTERLEALHILSDIQIHYGDMTDTSSVVRVLQACQPDEIYNLAAQSHVAVSFEEPEYTANADALGTLRLLEAIRLLGLEKKSRFYQASTSELFGTAAAPQTENTPFHPRSPYAIAKLYAYWITVNYREAYALYACNGILFNHESPLRGENFVTRKITKALARIRMGLQEQLLLGNLNAQRDWGHARDFVEMQWLMLQQEQPEDFVIATGEQHSVRDFVNHAAQACDMELEWRGTGEHETAILASTRVPVLQKLQGKTLIAVSKDFFRPTEADNLLGNPQKARERLGWTPHVRFSELIHEMVTADLLAAEKEARGQQKNTGEL